MLPLLFSRQPWWFGLYKKTKMVDFQMNLEAWLSEASLFANEPIDSINFDIPIDAKTNLKESKPVLSVPDIAWLDEKVDLSVPNNLDSLLDHRNETQASMEDDTAFLFSLLGSDFPSFDVFTTEEIDLAKQLDVENIINESASSDISDTHLASPRCNSLQINSPEFFPAQSPASPYSDISDASNETASNHIVQSPESTSFTTTDFTNSDFGSPQVHVSICDADNVASSSSFEPVLSIEEVSRSVRKRKFVNDGGAIPKVKVILTESGSDSSSCTKRPKDRRERKKVQNKEAAARYRIKKRMEEQVLSDEVEQLESHQKKLKNKHDDLQSEIKYLKNLMCEILVKKGVMK